MPDFLNTFLAQAGAVGVMAIVVAYLFRQYAAHLEGEIVYLRAKSDTLEQRIIELEGKVKA